jgi:hypothetical protein
MKANELRFGNLVDYYGEVVTINSIDDMDVGFSDYVTFDYPSLEEINPIPLTEEWLVRFGFEKRISSVCDSFYIGVNPVTKDWLFDITWLKNMIDYSYEGFPFYRNGHFTIKYVHSLQNLYFALTGEELTLRP